MIDIPTITHDEEVRKQKEKLDRRVRLTASIQGNEAKQMIFYDQCSRDWKFFVDNCLFILDPEADNLGDKNKPFLLWDYQERAGDEMVKAILGKYDLPVEKSRNLGVTWEVLAILLWGWLFHEWEVLVGSRKMEEVDKRGDPGTLFEKLRYMIERLPSFMYPYEVRKADDKMALLKHPRHGATIVGEANNPDFGRSDRRKVIFMDEFASWESTDRSAWQACGDTAGCRIPVSTPNRRGKDCWFYKIVKNAHDNDLPILRLHWSMNPRFSRGLYTGKDGKLRSPWYDRKERESADPQQIAQEQDINYDLAVGGKVFGNWDEETNISEDAEYDPNLPLYVAWDFGLDQTALLWIQPDRQAGVHNIIDEYINSGDGEGVDIFHYIDVVESKPYKSAIHYGDPHSGENRHITSGQSPKTILRRSGMIFRSKRARVYLRVMAGRNILPEVRVNPRCILAIEMFRNWKLKQQRTGNKAGGVPEHSEYSHIGEAFTYYAFNFTRQEANRKKPKTHGVIQRLPSGVTL